MKTSDFNFDLPKKLIAQEPVSPRDHSRLLVLDKKTGEIEDKKFFDIVDYLKKGDVLVLNNSKVIPARLIGKREKTGGKVEVFLVKRTSPSSMSADKRPSSYQGEGSIWQCMVGGKRVKAGTVILFGDKMKCKILKNNEDGTWEVGFGLTEKEMMRVVEEIGEVPLPPYIKPHDAQHVKHHETYQTTFASDEKRGSVAAPTAGLHFTSELLKKLKNKGVQIEYITLHVGLGTFAPVKVVDIKEHKMHSEYIEVKMKTISNILQAKEEKRRIISVGTTSTRTLESIAENYVSKFKIKELNQNLKFKIQNYTEWVDIFIYPGYEFKIVDAMITNFHLPKSTLIMLVSALANKKNIDKAYQHAINNHYRFYSYGDAMFIK